MGKLAADAVVDALRASILDGQLTPGDRLDETTLVGRFELSRNTLREAFRVLAHEHLVEHLPNRGVFVRRLTVKEARDVYRVRRILECGALREAAVLRTSAEGLSATQREKFEDAWATAISRIEQAAASGIQGRDSGDWKAVGTANGDFHIALVSLAGNGVLDRTVRTLVTEMRLLFIAVGAAREVHERYLDDNIHVAALVESGELARAIIALEEYLLRAEQHLVGRYAEQTSSGPS